MKDFVIFIFIDFVFYSFLWLLSRDEREFFLLKDDIKSLKKMAYYFFNKSLFIAKKNGKSHIMGYKRF